MSADSEKLGRERLEHTKLADAFYGGIPPSAIAGGQNQNPSSKSKPESLCAHNPNPSDMKELVRAIKMQIRSIVSMVVRDRRMRTPAATGIRHSVEAG